MTMTPVYLLTIPGNSTIQISQDELRSLLGQIEAQLHSSKVYRRALATLQQLLGSSAEQAKVLFKAVGREAIGLAFQQFAQHNQIVAESDVTVAPTIQQTNLTEVSPPTPQGPDCDVSQKITTGAIITDSNSPSKFQSQVVEKTAKQTVKSQKDSRSIQTALRWVKANKKPSKAEIAKQMEAEQRLEILRQIGQKLRKARESQGLSLSQLNVCTHVAISQMEAIENGNVELLPEDVYVRGFIRVMGNALGLNGTVLAASLPAGEPVKSILPPFYQSKSRSSLSGFTSGLELNSMHLYVGYTALVAVAVGGLSLMSQQQTNADKALNPDIIIPASSSLFKSTEKTETAKPGIKSSSTAGVSVVSDIAPPEAL
ncbi:MAG: helix-turn-helix domain-containing protein [Heteroscytonema crispum UTEX LB 1556]